ncbi:hypothetical protein BGX28_001756 [Mortierella sp. GBA30]|nr:hypothetical protein BGX28_001756 [Mortierella sp. GBA30]
MPRFNNSMTPKEIAQLAGEYCSNVRHLTCIDHFALPREMEGIRSFIHALSGLRTLRAVGFRSETINWSYGKTRSIIGALILRHSTSLEEIEFLACKKIWSKEQQRIFAQCSNLTRFWIKPTEEAAVGMKFGDIIAQEWVCGSLKELCLTLDRSVVVEEERPQFYTWSEKENLDSETIARMAYAQIGRLTKLEVLALSADRSVASMPMGTTFDWDLTLSKGYLVELSRLKNLRRLEISADLWLRMDQADVEFMDEQWPRLGEVGFGCSTKAVFQELTSQPHWRWLREKRCLQYLFLD